MTNEELQKEMIAAMKAKDKVRLSIIRQVKAEVKNIEVNERRDVTEEDVNSMIKRLIKQTSETLEMSIKAGTDQERTDNLTEQVKILESLLPAQVSGEELEALIEQVIAELGATSKKQMGQVMGALGKATSTSLPRPRSSEPNSRNLLCGFTKPHNGSTLQTRTHGNLTFNFKGATIRSAPFHFTSPCSRVRVFADLCSTRAVEHSLGTDLNECPLPGYSFKSVPNEWVEDCGFFTGM